MVDFGKREQTERESIGQKLEQVCGKNICRVLLIAAPEISQREFRLDFALDKRYGCFPPYGPGLVTAHLKCRGYVTEILDLNYEILSQVHSNPGQFQYTIWRDALKEKLETFTPDLVGISCIFMMAHEPMIEIAQAVKEWRQSLPVVVGGVHPSNAPEMVLRSSEAIDFISLYESEVSFPDLLDFVNGKVPLERIGQVATLIGNVYTALTNRAPPSGQDLNVPPEFHSLPIENYSSVGQVGSYTFLFRGKKAATVLSNKGCRAHCSFCAVRSINGPGVRARDVVAVVDEMEGVIEKYGIRHFMWLDDDLLFSSKRALALFKEIIRRKLPITWDATNGLIAAAINPEIAQAMVESGCVGLNLGIESGNPETLLAIHKPGTLDSFRRAKKILDNYPHVFVRGYLIIGFPNETVRQLLETVKFALVLSLDWYPISILTPIPSTEIYRTMAEEGLLEDNMQAGGLQHYAAGQNFKQRLREEREGLSAQEFLNLFTKRDPDSVPTREELSDLWFLIDYKVNYERILTMDHPVKLRLKEKQLTDVCDRLTRGNAMGNLFLAITKQRLGDIGGAREHLARAERDVKASEYWEKRFDTLDLYSLLDKTREGLEAEAVKREIRNAL